MEARCAAIPRAGAPPDYEIPMISATMCTHTRDWSTAMSTHLVSYYEDHDAEHGPIDLVDLEWLCSQSCEFEVLLHRAARGVLDLRTYRSGYAGTIETSDGGAIEYGAYPGGSETDYPVWCANCGNLLWHGLECWDPADGLETICHHPEWVEAPPLS